MDFDCTPRYAHRHEETDFEMSISTICFVAIVWRLAILVCFRLMALCESSGIVLVAEGGQMYVCVCVYVCEGLCWLWQKEMNKRAEDWSPASLWDSDALQMSQTSIHSHEAPHGEATTHSHRRRVCQTLCAALLSVVI